MHQKKCEYYSSFHYCTFHYHITIFTTVFCAYVFWFTAHCNLVITSHLCPNTHNESCSHAVTVFSVVISLIHHLQTVPAYTLTRESVIGNQMNLSNGEISSIHLPRQMSTYHSLFSLQDLLPVVMLLASIVLMPSRITNTLCYYHFFLAFSQTFCPLSF